MSANRDSDLAEQVQTIVDQVANHDSQRAARLLDELITEYGTGVVAAALLDVSTDAITTLRREVTQLRAWTEAERPLLDGGSPPWDGSPFQPPGTPPL